MTPPTDQPLMGITARIRKSPFYDATRRWGYRAYTIYNHTLMPLYFESIEADFEHLSTAVTLWDTSCQRQVEITGRDAARFVQHLVARDLSTCAIGQCKYVLLTTPAGGIINDPMLLKLGEGHFWLSLADSDVLLWAMAMAAGAGMDVAVSEPDVSPLQVQGPKSPALMHDLFGDWIADLRFFRFRETDLDGIPLVVSRTGWSGELGYELFLRDGARGDDLWERIMAAGRAHDIAPAGPNAISRIEAGLLSYGADMSIHENPFEAGLDRFVDLDLAADFIGKAALTEIRARGVTRRLAGIVVDGPPMAANQHPWPVAVDGAWSGRMTSFIHSPRLAKNIGLAMLAVDHATPGTAVTVETDAGMRTGTVTALPFRDGKRGK